MGSRVLDGANQKTMPGNIRAFNLYSGAIEWEFRTIPRPGEVGYDTWPKEAWQNEFISVNSWSGFTLDQENEMVFFGTDPPPMTIGEATVLAIIYLGIVFWPSMPIPEKGYGIFRLFITTWDYDIPCPPNLDSGKIQ